MSSRKKALRLIQKRSVDEGESVEAISFGEDVFQGETLPKALLQHWEEVRRGHSKLNPAFAAPLAEAMKTWALQRGATHFCHWFQPLTGSSAEKQEAFFSFGEGQKAITQFTAGQLLRGESDASSFPHGGLRHTSSARGYMTWDPTLAPFLKRTGAIKVLCIPALFFSWKGEALDFKIPLARSEDKVRAAALRLLSLLGIEAKEVVSTLGCEQEYFLIDRAFYLLRPDLMLVGRTLCGKAPAKGQELEDFYFSPIRQRVGRFMAEVERRALAVGIPLKLRHAEVAPGQFEFSPLFEKASLAVDHNVLLMELMQEVAHAQGFACLFHEKPFARVNGSGKHCNWSLQTERGKNLLDPKGEELLFLSMLVAVVCAVYRHGKLLRAVVASAGNDHRLGGHEAPPAIFSVHLGETLEKWLLAMERGQPESPRSSGKVDLGIPPLPDVWVDDSDRNRTSPFAFTGNKFEFRAVGASQHCALPAMVLNAVVAESLNEIVDEIEKEVLKKRPLQEVAHRILRRYLSLSKSILFSGDNYSAAWQREAKKRKLPQIERSAYAFQEWLTPSSLKVLAGVLSKKEVEARVEIFRERYCKTLRVEALLMQDCVKTQIVPAALRYQKTLAEDLRALTETGHVPPPAQTSLLEELSCQISRVLQEAHLLEKALQKAEKTPLDKKAFVYSEGVAAVLAEVRKHVDALEGIVDDQLWPLPKYEEMLYIL